MVRGLEITSQIVLISRKEMLSGQLEELGQERIAFKISVIEQLSWDK